MQIKRFSFKLLTLVALAVAVLICSLVLWIVSFSQGRDVAPGIGPGGGISGSMQIR
jgi:hypothetical protein